VFSACKAMARRATAHKLKEYVSKRVETISEFVFLYIKIYSAFILHMKKKNHSKHHLEGHHVLRMTFNKEIIFEL
jgi:hypothetical protein